MLEAIGFALVFGFIIFIGLAGVALIATGSVFGGIACFVFFFILIGIFSYIFNEI